MSNVLDHQKQQQLIGLGRLGWPVRRIAEATGVHRATARGYLTEPVVLYRHQLTERPVSYGSTVLVLLAAQSIGTTTV